MSANNQKPSKPFYEWDKLPNAADSKFWNIFESPEYKHGINFQILNELRFQDPNVLTDAQCRTQLSKLFALVNVLDFPEASKKTKEKDQLTETRLPE